MIQVLERYAIQQQVYKIRLNSGKQRVLAHQFYKNNEFVSLKKQKLFYEIMNKDWLDD